MSLEKKTKAFFDLFRELMAECDEVLEWGEELPKGIRIDSYGLLYELPIQQIAAYLFQQAGILDEVKAAAEEADRELALIELARTVEPKFDLDENTALVTIVAMVVLFTNIESMRLYSMPMNDLLERVSRGDDDALFQAVVLDAASLGAKSVANRIATASFYDDRSFFHRLSQAITRTKPVRPKRHLDETRLLFQLFEDAGVLEKMTDSELTEWAVNKIGVYPDSKDPQSAIRDQRRKRNRAKGGPKR